MRYILDDLGYVQAVTFSGTIECDNKSCTEYVGTIPTGYTSLEEWADNANIRAYSIVSNNLTYNEARDTELQAEWEEQNSPQVQLWTGSSKAPTITVENFKAYTYFVLYVGSSSSTLFTPIPVHYVHGSGIFRGIGGHETTEKGVEIFSFRGTTTEEENTLTISMVECYSRTSYNEWGGTAGTQRYFKRLIGVR